MNDDIQVGDTVEILKDDVGFHPTENRRLKKGDRVVVHLVSNSSIWYKCALNDFYIYLDDVKKVIPNQVEVKFR
jgi:hypothetical protein